MDTLNSKKSPADIGDRVENENVSKSSESRPGPSSRVQDHVFVMPGQRRKQKLKNLQLQLPLIINGNIVKPKINSKYNFIPELDDSMDHEERISRIQKGMSDLQEKYSSLKEDLTLVEKKRRRSQKREREKAEKKAKKKAKKAAAAAAASKNE